MGLCLADQLALVTQWSLTASLTRSMGITNLGHKMLRRISEQLQKQNWGQALFELLIVAVGILMALQVDRWREESNNRDTEEEYLSRLSDDISEDIESLDRGVNIAELRRTFAELLMASAENPALALESPVDFMLAINQSAFTFTPALTSNTFDELRSTGNMRLLRNTELKSALFSYYRYDQAQRQFIDLQQAQEIRHFERATGVLTNSQAKRIDDEWGIVDLTKIEEVRNSTVDLAEVEAAVDRFLSKPDFIAWLPISYGMQIDLAETNSERRRLAIELQSLLSEIADNL